MDSDVKAFNGTLAAGGSPAALQHVGGKFVVTRGTDNVVFELCPASIEVRHARAIVFTARPRLEEDGECLLDVDGQCLKLWQVSRKALEGLLFG